MRDRGLIRELLAVAFGVIVLLITPFVLLLAADALRGGNL